MSESPDAFRHDEENSETDMVEEPVMLVFSISQCQSLAELTVRFRSHIRHLPTKKCAADTPSTASPASIQRENKSPANN